MQKKLAIFVVVCLLGVGLLGLRSMVTAQNGALTFKTPEDAINYYMQGIIQADATKILDACAVNEMAEKFNFEFYLDRIQAFVPYSFEAPATAPFYIETNKAQVTRDRLFQARMFAYALLSTEDTTSGKTIVKMDAERVAKFVKDIDPKRLAQVQVKKSAISSPNAMATTSYQNAAQKNAKSYGADEYTERVTLFSFEENFYYVGFSLLRYGEDWKIAFAYSAMANTDSLGTPKKTTEKDFDAQFGTK